MTAVVEEMFDDGIGNGIPADLLAAWENRVGVNAAPIPGKQPTRHLFRSGRAGIEVNSPLYDLTPQGPVEDFTEITFWRPLSLVLAFALIRTPCEMNRSRALITQYPSRHVLVCTQTLPGSGRVSQRGNNILYGDTEHLIILDNNVPFTQCSDAIADHLGIWVPIELLHGPSPDGRVTFGPQVIESPLGRATAAFIKNFAYDVAVRGAPVDLETELVAVDLIRLALMGSRHDELSSTTEIVGAVSDVIERNFRDPGFTTDSIAQSLHMSRRHLYRQLAESGLSPATMIMTRRLRRAEKLVLSLDDPDLGHIARVSGFTSASMLRNRFRAEFGMTPDQYRRAYLESNGERRTRRWPRP